MMHAQTKVQLFNELLAYGYDKEQLRLVLRAFELGVQLFACRFQACGKPYLAHGIGTASILAWLRARVELVAAGIIHNVYAQGNFAFFGAGNIRSKRKMILKSLGDEVEQYLCQFRSFAIAPKTIRHLYDRFDQYCSMERRVLLLSLVETLEKFQDLEVLYYNDPDRMVLIHQHGHTLIDLANRLGYPALAQELERSFAEILCAQVPETFRHAANHSLIISRPTFLEKVRNQVTSARVRKNDCSTL